MTLGERIICVRKSKGLTQAAAGNACGISRTSMCHLENDKVTNPGLETLRKLAGGLGVDVGLLVTDDPQVIGRFVLEAAKKQNVKGLLEFFVRAEAQVATVLETIKAVCNSLTQEMEADNDSET